MAIIAKSVLDARRAAAAVAAAREQQQQRDPETSTMPAAVVMSAPSPSLSLTQAPDPTAPDRSPPQQRRGHATKDDAGKWQPTSDYLSGFAKPPVEHQFKPGGKGGPGRPKGSVSHDALMQKHLKQKREVSVGGRRQKLSTRELLVMSTVKAALEGKDKHARTYALASSERLYPSREGNDHAAATPAISASDALSLAEYEQEMREQIRAELREELRRERDAGEGARQ